MLKPEYQRRKLNFYALLLKCTSAIIVIIFVFGSLLPGNSLSMAEARAQIAVSFFAAVVIWIAGAAIQKKAG